MICLGKGGCLNQLVSINGSYHSTTLYQRIIGCTIGPLGSDNKF